MGKKQDEGKICDEIYLSLGSNIGDRRGNIQKALDELQKNSIHLLAESKMYETVPWGMETQALFLNNCVRIRTELSPNDLLGALQIVESSLGRVRSEEATGYVSRIIDIDIIYYGKQVLNTLELTLPHPQMHHRKFVLQPLGDIAAQFVHPTKNKSTLELLKDCRDKLEVTPYNA